MLAISDKTGICLFGGSTIAVTKANIESGSFKYIVSINVNRFLAPVCYTHFIDCCKAIHFKIRRESEAFEELCPARLDAILKESYQTEQNLKREKERMRERLTIISRVLQRSDDK